MMNTPQEAVGAVPQPGVNPAAAQPPSAPSAPPAGPSGLSEDDLKALRSDPEVVEVFTQVAGVPVPMDQVDPQTLAEVAGMVEKLGVAGAVDKINSLLSPEQKAGLQAEAAKANAQPQPQAQQPGPPVGGGVR